MLMITEDDNYPRLIIMMGLPLSGKSTIVKQEVNIHKNLVSVCPDTIRLAMHGNQFIGSAEPFVWANAQLMVRSLLRDGYSVIVDATNTTVERRKMWKSIAKEFNTQLAIYWVKLDKEDCIKRNDEIGRLDNSIINRMAEQLEPPTIEEGMVRIYL